MNEGPSLVHEVELVAHSPPSVAHRGRVAHHATRPVHACHQRLFHLHRRLRVYSHFEARRTPVDKLKSYSELRNKIL